MVAFPLPVDQRLASQIASMGRQLTLVAHGSNNPVATGTTLNREGLTGQSVAGFWGFDDGNDNWSPTNAAYMQVPAFGSANSVYAYGLIANGSGQPFYTQSPQIVVAPTDTITVVGDLQVTGPQLNQVFMELTFFDQNNISLGAVSDLLGSLGPSTLTVTSAELYQITVPSAAAYAIITIGDQEVPPTGANLNIDNVTFTVYTGIPGVVDATKIVGSVFEVGGTEGGLFVYAGTPQAGNLIGSWAPSAGADEFGNQFPAGLNGNEGLLTGMQMLFSTITNSEIDNPTINAGTWSMPTLIGGDTVDTVITFDSAGGALLVYLSGVTSTTLTGAGTWTAPAGSTGPGLVECTGDGGSGGSTTGASGAGGGEYAAEPAYSIVAGQVYNYHCGQGGSAVSNGAGLPGVGTSFDDNNVFANGGSGGPDFPGGNGGTGSPATTHFAGGKGGGAFDDAGAGGGSSAAAGSAGAAGSDSHSSTGSSGGTAPAGGGNGGAGGNAGASGVAGSSPGGGGGGAGNGSSGTHIRTYTPTKTASYFGMDAATFGGTAGGQRNVNGNMYQGLDPSSGGNVSGTQWSVMEFNTTQIQSDLSGVTVDSIAIVFKNQHANLNSGQTLELAGIGAFAFPSVAGGLPTSGDLTLYTIAGGTTKTLSLPAAYGTKFQNGTYSGFILGPGVGTATEYGYETGGTSGSCPQLVITYHTGGGALLGGAGAPGQVKVTYKSNTGRTLIGSWAGSTFTDTYGNAIPVGLYLPKLLSAPAAPTNAGAILYGATGTGALSTIDASGMAGVIPSSQSDATQFTITSTSTAQASKLWTIPASNANANTVYRLTVWGTMNPKNVANAPVWNVVAFGNTLQILTTTGFSTAQYAWKIVAEAEIVATGGSGSFNLSAVMTVNISGGTAFGQVADVFAAGLSVSTTTSNTIDTTFGWGVITGSPTFTSYGSLLERLGA